MVASLSRIVVLAVVCGVAAMPTVASVSEHRSRGAAREFQRLHPCPSTGRTTGACHGYVKDHIVPLVCGGPDSVDNLQWQMVAAAKAKDRWERKGCRR